MRLRDLADIYRNEEIYIVGSGPTLNVFPLEFLRDKICLGLNDAYKAHPAITPIAFFHHEIYAHAGNRLTAPYHENFQNIKYPIVKVNGKDRTIRPDWDDPHYYYFDWSHEIEDIWTMTKETDVLYYTPEGCSLHAALQVCWILGARTVYTIGCDSRTMGGRHYAAFDKNGFRDDDILSGGEQRNYDSYVFGSLIVREFLARKGMTVLSLSPVIGYHLVDYQYDVLRGEIPLENVYDAVRQTAGTPASGATGPTSAPTGGRP